MPGMNTGLSANNPTVVAAFHASLLRQGFVVFLILAIIGLAWNVLRSLQLRQASGDDAGLAASSSLFPYPEPVARRLLRISFGLIWIFDGILQAQSSMPLGMAPQVMKPAAAASPGWVQHLVNAVASTWSYHPIAAPAAAVWIQIGIGVWLLAAPRGKWSRMAGLASVGWGLIVWVFGEAFGGIFAPGLTWAFGAPGAALFYCAAGILIAGPERWWSSPRLGRAVLSTMGLFFVGMAVLQAWPGRGFWQGQTPHLATPGTLSGMVHQMSQTSEPNFLSSMVAGFASFDAAHGWAVNLFLVVALAAIGATFLTGRPRIVRYGVAAGVVLCLADWVLVEDFGFLGGVGTDPNSMIPMALVFVAGYLAISRLPATDGAPVVAISAASGAGRPWRERLAANPVYAFRAIAALGAIGIVLVGAAPMAVAATNPNADPILSQAIDGTPDATDTPTPAFQLVDQDNRTVSLSSLHGKAVAITFLDPVCVSDCPTIAQEFRIADGLLGTEANRVEMVAVNLNPRYLGEDYLVAFDHQEGLDALPNWHYLTGSLPQLTSVWNSFGAQASYSPGGAMIAHSDIGYVIDPSGHTRYILDTDPGPGSQATNSSFAVTLANEITNVLRSP
jgi:cytochrome oxidase Cu insertion factor (SCO1/SenC/PrrC family)